MRFANPEYLLLLLTLPLLAVYYWRWEARRRGALAYSSIRLVAPVRRSAALRWRALLPVLRLAALALLVIGLARPQFGWSERYINTQGLDIVLALDVSESMRADDFRPNRLEAAKAVIKDFIAGREADRISVVIFGSAPMTLCPPTLDYGAVTQFVDSVDFGIIDGNSTAIGMGLASSLKNLRQSDAPGKVVILLTDGENNAGTITPATAADMAKALGVRVYAVGVGSDSPWLVVRTPLGLRRVPNQAPLDAETLKKIAETTGGRFYLADDENKLREIYDQIGQLEKSRAEIVEYHNYEERMQLAVVPAIVLLLLELVLAGTRFVKLP
ncbi:MAG: VWA domain-containing protein [Candidatus Sumerlaeia bacterium]